MNNKKLELTPIGRVIAENDLFQVRIDKDFIRGLKEVDRFSHVIVSWWAHEHDNSEDRNLLTTALPYAQDIEAGVFACRSQYRPNPIGLTCCEIIDFDLEKGLLTFPYIDAFHDSPVLDIKPYIPVSDRIKNVKVASWFSDWPEWYEEAEGFFSENPEIV